MAQGRAPLTIATRTQVLGEQSIADELNVRLADIRYRRFRCAVAFARWSGLHLIDPALRAFASRKRTSLECFIGVDLGGTTIEALTYLHELPTCTVRIVRSGIPGVVFHPKVYVLEGPEDWWAVVGSGNLSTGGFHSNIETYVVLEGRADTAAVLAGLFDPYEERPFTNDHVRKLDDDFLRELAAELPRFTSRPPDREGSRKPSDPDPLDPDFRPPTPSGRPPSPAVPPRPGPPPDPTPVPTAQADLYVELWDETGGGTQVQLPKRAFTDYFGASAGTTTYIDLQTPGGELRGVRLQWFSNVTFRIGLPFVGGSASGAQRRGVLRFRRTGPDAYRVDLRLAGKQGYSSWLSRCIEQTGPHSKRWGIR